MACDCHVIKDLKKVQREHFEWYPLIFTGAVEQSNEDGTYTFRIAELFKGSLADSLIYGKSEGYCSGSPREWEYMWLVYAKPNDDGTITLDACSLSRSFAHPYLPNKQAHIPPPPPRASKDNDQTMTMIEDEFIVLKYKKRALKVLRSEIEQLRRWSNELKQGN